MSKFKYKIGDRITIKSLGDNRNYPREAEVVDAYTISGGFYYDVLDKNRGKDWKQSYIPEYRISLDKQWYRDKRLNKLLDVGNDE